MSTNKTKEKSLTTTFALRKEVQQKYSVKSGVIQGVWIAKDKERTVMPTWYTGKPIWLPLIMKSKPIPPKKEFTVQLTAEYRLNFPDLVAVASITIKLRPNGMYLSHTSNPLRFE